jgi:alkanesulfonate monooxygenase SsuD/methylene tetrahydromethanopterin reductase-like flavin-dependent oxidoreductase (luciferase family)
MTRAARLFTLFVTLALTAGALEVTDALARNHKSEVDIGLSATVTAGITVGDARQLAAKHQLTGAKPLPPGIRKNLARGKPLPPGIARQTMPGAFLGELPSHEGYEWRQAGADLVLVVSGSLVISDILESVFD